MESETNNHVLQKQQKLDAFDIIKESVSLSFKNINFIIFTFLTSLPLFFFLVYYEIFLQKTLVETFEILSPPTGYIIHYGPLPEHIINSMTWDFSCKLIQLGLLYLIPHHVLGLCTMIVTVDLASKVDTEERPMTLKDMVHKPINIARLKGSFITSIQVLFLSTCTLLGLIWLVTNYYVFFRQFIYGVVFAVLYQAAFVALLAKYLEWSAVWSMSMVVSVLEGVHGAEALTVSACFSRGSKRCGQILMLVFFAWGLALRLPCIYRECYAKGNGIVLQIGLFCVGNVVKWVACMVYFYCCKKSFLDKKVDQGAGTGPQTVDTV